MHCLRPDMHACCCGQVRLAHNYLKDVLQYNFPELRARAAAAQAEARAQQVLVICAVTSMAPPACLQGRASFCLTSQCQPVCLSSSSANWKAVTSFPSNTPDVPVLYQLNQVKI